MKCKSIICLFTVAVFCLISFSACKNEKKEEFLSTTTTSAVMNVTAETKAPTETTKSSTPVTTVMTNSSKQKEVVGNNPAAVAKLAQSLVGKPFRYGAAGPDAFDNSGFLVYCYAQNGLILPRKTGDIANTGMKIDKKDLLPGDAVFFCNENQGIAEYVGIYIGEGQFVASNDEDSPVSIHLLNASYFESRYLFARRFF